MSRSTRSWKSRNRPGVGVAPVDQDEPVQELPQRPGQRVPGADQGGGYQPTHGEPDGGGQHRLAPQPGNRDHGREQPDDERRLPGERRERHEDACQQPALLQHRPEHQDHEQHERGLLARPTDGIGHEPGEGEQRGSGGDPGQPGVEQVADQDVEHPHAGHRDQQHQQPHAQDVVHPDDAGSPHPDRRHEVGERPRPVEDADVRRHALHRLLGAVGVEREVAGEDAVEALDDEDHQGGHGQERSERVDPPPPAVHAASMRSTATGAWSEAPVPARSSRSMNAPETRAASDGEASTKSMRSPRFRSNRCR